MKEYIERADIKALLERYGATDDAMALIDTIPAADVAEVRHGRWEEANDGDGVVCSECRTDFCTMVHETEKFRFCPNCGACMGKENEK